MIVRPRRLRGTKNIRSLCRETRLSADSLIYPMFVTEGKTEEIASMPGQFRYSLDDFKSALEEVYSCGVTSVMLFGIPNEKDTVGSSGFDENGIVQRALKIAKKEVPNMYLITDVCMCEYTSHGHCGILGDKEVLNDETLAYLGKIALSHVVAGADMVAPSDMMDGRVLAIRNTLDENGYCNIPIMSYAAKYASAFYGPFREAADSAPSLFDRKGYQMDYHNAKEGVKEALIDVYEGADIVMVKPALSYLDVIYRVAQEVDLPVAAYSVSGEYAMIKATAKMGYVDEKSMICESAVSMFRAGANILITYYAMEIARYINEGEKG